MNFITVQSEGSLFSAETLSDIYHAEAPGQSAKEFGQDGKIRLSDEIAACWGKARVHWAGFRLRLRRLGEDSPREITDVNISNNIEISISRGERRKITDHKSDRSLEFSISRGESATSETRQLWIVPLLQLLGFNEITFARTAAEVGGRTYAVSHRDGNGNDGLPRGMDSIQRGLPIHIVGVNQALDRRSPSGRPRLSPHALVQEYLNRTEHLWAIVTNGYRLRFLRDAARMSRPTYLEFDLETMMQSEQFAEFQLLYRLLHRSRWPQEISKAHDCWLEKYYQSGIDAGGRVREKLREGVEAALRVFGNGFLSHPDNTALREKLESGQSRGITDIARDASHHNASIPRDQLTATDYYRQLLHLIYRFLFLMVSEERKLVGPPVEKERFQRIYNKHYSISHLREKAEHPLNPEERYWDLWEGVKQTFRLYCDEQTSAILNIQPLDSDLFGPFATPDPDNSRLLNRDFLQGFRYLSLFEDQKKIIRRVNYAYLDVEELGSVYESLLDFHPVVRSPRGITAIQRGKRDARMQFELVSGTQRKSTGSYYTRPELVQELIKSALEPVIEDRLALAPLDSNDLSFKCSSENLYPTGQAKTPEEQEKALLSLKICDPACGSGHFLLAAARRIGKELAKVRSGEDEPAPEQFRLAVREVVTHCLYGVDLNPLAVDLCKVALWLEGHNKGVPLTFLDHRIKCGNSLIGVMDLDALKNGIPDDAYKPVTGDDKKAAAALKKRNKTERFEWEKGIKNQGELFDKPLRQDSHYFAEAFNALAEIPDQPVDSVQQKARLHEELRKDPNWYRDWTACNLWTAAFFTPLHDSKDPRIPTTDALFRYLQRPNTAHGQLIGAVNKLALEHKFFHWPLEFPDVFEQGGFDVVLGNPPWERIKLQEQEFFATRDPEIAAAPNKAARTKMIKALSEDNPSLAAEFADAKQAAEAASRFVRASGRFPLTAVGDVNTYALFAELARNLLTQRSRAGIILPTGIATDDASKNFFRDISTKQNLVSLFDFENRGHLFPTLHTKTKFCLFSISNDVQPNPDYSFLCTRVEDLDENLRVFSLSPHDILLINPNTQTLPLFRTQLDVELTKKIYQFVPVLVNERTRENPWGIRFMTMFHMSNDSHLFHHEQESGRLPLYEAKMFYHYDHRWSTFCGKSTIECSPEQKKRVDFTITPRYWVGKDEVEKRLDEIWDRKWYLCFRGVTDSRNERTAVFGLIPYSGVGNSAPIIILDQRNLPLVPCLTANLSSLVFDYIAKQKVGGMNINFFVMKQFPVFNPSDYSESDIDFITPRFIELIYTARDMQSFAADIGYLCAPFRWDEDRRALLRAELDAYYAHLYGLTRDELRYILDPQEVYGEDFPGETFRVLKEKEIKKYGEYRTRRLVLEAWDRLFEKETYVPKEVLRPQVTQEIEPEPTVEDIQAMREYATLLIAANVESALRVYAAKILYFCTLRGSSLRDKLNFTWTLEKHGPYDHAIGQLRDRMVKAGYLERVPTQDYGKPFKITPAGENKLQEFEQVEVIRQSKSIIESVLREFAGKTSREMELRATLVFLHQQHPDWGYDQLVAALQAEKTKRRFGENEIDEAVMELEELGYVDERIE